MTITARAAEGFLPGSKGHAPDGHFNGSGLYDCPGSYKGGGTVAGFGGQPVTQGENLAFHFLACHCHTLRITLYK
jgi:hypothetical protein